MISTAFSVASYSAILTQNFAMVGISTLVPAAIAIAAKGLKGSVPESVPDNVPENEADNVPDNETESETKKTAKDPLAALFGPASKKADTPGPLEGVTNIIDSVAKSQPDALQLLAPKSAKIEAEFQFRGNESYKGEAEVGAMINVVTVKAGFAALFEAESSNKIKLTVDFGLVEYKLT